MTSLLPLAALLLGSAQAQDSDAHVHVEVHIDGENVADAPAAPESPEPPARVCQADCEGQADASVDNRPEPKAYTALRLDSMAVDHSGAWGLSLRRNGKRDGWVGAEGRWTHDGRWMGRFGLGFDVLGKSPFDVRLGLVGGHIGDWQTPDHRSFSIGTEIGFGWHPGRFILDYRTIGGKRPEGRGIRTENHTVIGFRPLERLELYADFVAIDPGGESDIGMGVGAGWRF